MHANTSSAISVVNNGKNVFVRHSPNGISSDGQKKKWTDKQRVKPNLYQPQSVKGGSTTCSKNCETVKTVSTPAASRRLLFPVKIGKWVIDATGVAVFRGFTFCVANTAILNFAKIVGAIESEKLRHIFRADVVNHAGVLRVELDGH